ncbi:MAG: ROK family protein [Candidatus Hadarchaeales archaeon]
MYLGIDIGATKIRGAIFDGKEMVCKAREPTETGSVEGFTRQLVRISESLCKKAGVKPKELEGTCVASFGPLNYRMGELVNPVHLPFKQTIPIVKPLQKKLGSPVYLINDCVAAVMGEHEFGLGSGIDDLVFVNLGAGIGAGVYVDGRVLFGKDGNAHEIGHYTIDPEGKLRCGCGRRGHWEAYCSGPGIPNLAKLKGYPPLKSEELLDRAGKGDKKALQLLEEIGRLNAIGFANVINSYDPELVIVGGALALAGKELILRPIRERVADHAVNAVPPIELSRLGEEAGVYGAVVAATQSYFIEFLSSLRR